MTALVDSRSCPGCADGMADVSDPFATAHPGCCEHADPEPGDVRGTAYCRDCGSWLGSEVDGDGEPSWVLT